MNAIKPSEDELERQCRKKIAEQLPAKLFHYTDDEDLRIRRAKQDAEKFMEKFGLAPRQPKIDLSHYENNIKTDWYGKD